MIPVIINNRDLLTWTKAMVEKISTYEGVGDIIIVDNGSSYPPLLDWYRTSLCKVYMYPNFGHPAPWISGIVQDLKSKYYVVTDPDLGLEDTPKDTLLYLKDRMKIADKVGLGLNWEIVQKKSPYYERLNLYERDRWRGSKIENGVYLDVPIDTTFAMYKTKDYFIGGGSTTYPYVARHIPWEFSVDETKANEEFMYYIKNASECSTYKYIMGLI